MSPKTPQSGLLEEAEAMPAESVRTERSQTANEAVSLNSVSSQFVSIVIKVRC